jgi:hypothetical protein
MARPSELKVYCAFDPIAKSLHLGNLPVLVVLCQQPSCKRYEHPELNIFIAHHQQIVASPPPALPPPQTFLDTFIGHGAVGDDASRTPIFYIGGDDDATGDNNGAWWCCFAEHGLEVTIRRGRKNFFISYGRIVSLQ